MKNNMFRHLVLLLLALFPFVGWAQQKNYDGQHVSIKLADGNSLDFDLGHRFNYGNCFSPIVKDGKIVWKYPGYVDFFVDNVESIDFRNFAFDEGRVREALIEFYQAMDGDRWNDNKNWCSDKPIWEWYGINRCLGDNKGDEFPWVTELWFNCSPIGNPLFRKIPECISRMGPIQNLGLPVSSLEGEIPAFLGNIYTLETILLNGNRLTGTIPENIAKLPYLTSFDVADNLLEGPLPEQFILDCMNKEKMPAGDFMIINNNFSGKVPQTIQQHPRFANFWPGIVIQNTPLDISDLVLPAPVFTAKDINGGIVDLAAAYKKNKYTLLYKWGFWSSFAEAFNQKLIPACKAYKDKGLEVIGIHYDLNSIGDDGLVEYMKTHDIPWNNIIYKDWNWNHDGTLNDNACVFQSYGVPQVFLVDQNGHIIFNSLMDEKGLFTGGCNRDDLFPILEKELGPIEYNYYTSSDYSHDGEVITLQTATIGQGIDLVFVGEAFTDKDLEEGVFDQRMTEALDQFFKFEPYRSLRDRFNVYAVKTVSPNSEFADGCTHAIDVDYEKALEYAAKVPYLIANRPMYVTVVYKHSSGGRSYCMMMEDNSYVCFAMDGITNVLNHEAGGHGIGKLFDEYVEQGNESLSLPEENKNELENQWTTLGWGANVDWRSDPSEVKWSKFISDARYADEKIGVYEGSYLYQFGAYRPTENSMMRYNDTPFNAPSREAIYKRVMKESEGDSWTYDYETFVAFDAPGHEQFVNSLKSVSGARGQKAPKTHQMQRTAPPVFLKGTWRDALNKKKN